MKGLGNEWDWGAWCEILKEFIKNMFLKRIKLQNIPTLHLWKIPYIQLTTVYKCVINQMGRVNDIKILFEGVDCPNQKILQK